MFSVVSIALATWVVSHAALIAGKENDPITIEFRHRSVYYIGTWTIIKMESLRMVLKQMVSSGEYADTPFYTFSSLLMLYLQC